MHKLALLTAATMISTSPALAHVGDHTGLSWSALAAHLLEPDHLAFAVTAVLIGIVAYRVGRRAGVRAAAAVRIDQGRS